MLKCFRLSNLSLRENRRFSWQSINLVNRNLCNGIFNEVPYYGLLHFVRNDEAGENANAFARHKILQISRKQWLGFRHY
ncbi:hypothetical protein [Helicobacter rodentium]|uniref:hypothetical protein n=1 Tax=Helicobacter rodentium TaxID=59617 RepID=UPI0023F3788F|nr:hypothetical protein [Helicobacter rodentium]